MGSPAKISLLCPKIGSLGQGLGGLPEITWEDVAFALATMTGNNASLFARVKYGSQDGLRGDLLNGFRLEILTLAGEKGWNIPPDKDSPVLRVLSLSALVEAIQGPIICKTCNGTKYARNPKKPSEVKPCTKCDGGIRKRGAKWHADLNDITRYRWRAIIGAWESQYKEIFGITERWEGAIRKAMGRGLRY